MALRLKWSALRWRPATSATTSSKCSCPSLSMPVPLSWPSRPVVKPAIECACTLRSNADVRSVPPRKQVP